MTILPFFFFAQNSFISRVFLYMGRMDESFIHLFMHCTSTHRIEVNDIVRIQCLRPGRSHAKFEDDRKFPIFFLRTLADFWEGRTTVFCSPHCCCFLLFLLLLSHPHRNIRNLESRITMHYAHHNAMLESSP